MRFGQHYYLHRFWISKGMRKVVADPGIFKGKYPGDEFGMSTAAANAVRYWLKAFELIKEDRTGACLTDFGELIYQNDPYIEEEATLLFLQYKIATNREKATAWYLFFNKFDMPEFTREDFVSRFSEYSEPANLELDFRAILNTYIPSGGEPEDNTDCPLSDLGLIKRSRTGIYCKSRSKHFYEPRALLAAAFAFAGDRREINLSRFFHDTGSIG